MSPIRSFLRRTKSALRGGIKSTMSERSFLVVDDDPEVRRLVSEYLESFGCKHVLIAPDSVQALVYLRTEKVDFIISDWDMPGGTGLDLLRMLRSDERFRHIPFLIITSPISQERIKIEDAAALSVDGYLIKPFRAQALKEKISGAMGKAQTHGRNGALVVDDNAETRDTIVEYLKKMGFGPVYEASDGDEGFAALQVHAAEIAFVVSDWEMPRLAGIDLLKRIRVDAVLGQTPFIMVTSQSSIERLKLNQALEADVDNYLLKPFKLDDLKKKVEAASKRAKAHLALENEFLKAEEALEGYHWEDAIARFKKILDQQPTSVRAHVGMGVAYRNIPGEQSMQKAVQLFRKGIALNPRLDEPYIELALTYEHARAVDNAIAVLRSAMRVCLFSDIGHYHLGRLLLLKGLKEEGEAEIKKAIELNPEFEEAKALLAGGQES